MKITKRQLKRIIREEYSKLKRRGLIKESPGMRDPGTGVRSPYGNPDEYIENMEMGIGYSDAENMEITDMDKLFDAVADIQKKRFNYEDLAMAPDDVIQRLIDDSEPIFELAMEATYGEGYDQYPLSDRWRGFLIALLSMGR